MYKVTDQLFINFLWKLDLIMEINKAAKRDGVRTNIIPFFSYYSSGLKIINNLLQKLVLSLTMFIRPVNPL